MGFGLPSLPDLPKFKTGMSNIDMSLTNEFKEINDLLVRIGKVEKDCLGEKDEQEAIAEIADDFLRTKAQLYSTLQEVRTLIRERHDIQKRMGNNVETIQKKSQISEKLRGLQLDIDKLQEVYKKQAKQKKKLKLTDEEIESRFADVQVLKRQVDEIHGIAQNSNQYSTNEIRTLTEIRAENAERGQMRFGPNGTAGGGGYEEPSDADRSQVNRWKERDKQFDEQLGQIGEGVDRLGEVAVQIGHKADEQAALTTQLHSDADVATDELVEMNNRIKKILGNGGMGFNCCCKLLLAVILVALIGWSMTLISNKIKNNI